MILLNYRKTSIIVYALIVERIIALRMRNL